LHAASSGKTLVSATSLKAHAPAPRFNMSTVGGSRKSGTSCAEGHCRQKGRERMSSWDIANTGRRERGTTSSWATTNVGRREEGTEHLDCCRCAEGKEGEGAVGLLPIRAEGKEGDGGVDYCRYGQKGKGETEKLTIADTGRRERGRRSSQAIANASRRKMGGKWLVPTGFASTDTPSVKAHMPAPQCARRDCQHQHTPHRWPITKGIAITFHV
jgi:hypothetical protein